MTRKTLLLMILVLWFCKTTIAQFKMDAEIRPRTEYKDGYKTLLSDGDRPALVTSQRSRLNFGFTDERLSTLISVQDVRVWGELAYKTDVGSIGLHEAWAGYNFTETFSIKFGRQVFAYDDNRLLGPSNWNNIGATHDAALFRYEKNKSKIHLGLAYNNDKDKNSESNYPVDFYKYLGFIWINSEITDGLSASLLNLADGYQKKKSDDVIFSRYTSGLYARYKIPNTKIELTGSFYYQYGMSADSQQISANFSSFSLGYNLTSELKAIMAIENFTGDDASKNDNRLGAFSNLYGNGHNLYGYMDYFTDVQAHTKNGGLRDIYLRLQYKPLENLTTELTAHHFAFTNYVVDSISVPGTNKRAGNSLGTEIDFMASYKLSKSFEIQAGYSTMLATRSMEILKKGDASRYQQWAWIMLIFKPVLIKN